MRHIMLCLMIVLHLSSCALKTASISENARHTNALAENSAQSSIKIVTTFYPLYIMCLNITEGVPGVELSCMTASNVGCLHDYTLTTKDAAAVEKADVIVANGAGMETFLGQLLEAKGEKIIVAASGYPLLDDNPHIFVSVKGARYEVDTIAKGLAALDSAHKELYNANAKRYDEKLSALSSEMHKRLERYKGRSIVTFHEAFPYFADEFSFNVLSIVEEENAPSAREMAQIVSRIKEEKGKSILGDGGKKECNIALFAEPQYPAAAAHLIEAETALAVHILDPCVTGDMERNAYIKAQQLNAAAIETAFTESYDK